MDDLLTFAGWKQDFLRLQRQRLTFLERFYTPVVYTRGLRRTTYVAFKLGRYVCPHGVHQSRQRDRYRKNVCIPNSIHRLRCHENTRTWRRRSVIGFPSSIGNVRRTTRIPRLNQATVRISRYVSHLVRETGFGIEFPSTSTFLVNVSECFRRPRLARTTNVWNRSVSFRFLRSRQSVKWLWRGLKAFRLSAERCEYTIYTCARRIAKYISIQRAKATRDYN